MPAPISMDLRRRIVGAVERGSSIREAAWRFAVSSSAAIKLMQRVRATGSAGPARYGGHRRPLLAPHEADLRRLVEATPDITLAELRPSCSDVSASSPASRPSTTRSAGSGLRAAVSVRCRWLARDFKCTSLNHPARTICARPRASLRSVFATIAESAAFTCRVFRQTTGRPRAARHPPIHSEGGPPRDPPAQASHSRV